MKTRSHVADLKKSKRLKRLHAFLKSQGRIGATTREIIRWTGNCSVPQSLHELRRNGLTITTKMARQELDGTRVFRHTLVKSPK